MFEVINTVSEKDIKDEFVAIGSYINDTKIPFHSVIIIKYNNETLQYHYTGYDISYDNYIDKACFHKITNTINEKLIPSFIAMCKRVLKTATARYGFFYSGEYYDINGNHFSEKPVGETMTCAGFCINILKGFLETDYLVYQDWNPSSHPTVDYLENYSSRYGLEKDKIEESHRRISPLELLCSGFFSDLPIRKHQIDTKTDIIQDYFNNY